nr:MULTISPECIES: hypothetical protein [unclassified Providencia]
MIVKLLTAAAILFSASGMATNQCKPDDVCIVFRPDSIEEKGFSVECENIYLAELKDDLYDSKKLIVKMTNPIDIKNKSSLTGYSFGVINILNHNYGGARIDISLSDNIYLSIDESQVNAADALISCVDSLKAK